jgi:hypothetical protein
MSEISVIVVSLVGGDSLIEMLQSVKAVKGECLVLLSSSKNDIATLQKQFPTVQFVSRDELSVPMARKRGVELASGNVVALLEDTSLPADGWYEAVTEAFSESDVIAVGGPVVLSSKLGGSYLALGCGEYGRFHPDRFSLMAKGEVMNNALLPVARLPGNNLAYRREPLLNVLCDKEHGLIEGEINEQLKANGEKLYMQPAMLVTYSMMDAHGARLKTRFNHGRLFAGNRVAGQGWKTRISWFVKSLLLPAVLSLRGWSSMTHAVDKLAWPKVMLWVFLMETAWAMGEAVGYLRGVGSSLEAWH